MQSRSRDEEPQAGEHGVATAAPPETPGHMRSTVRRRSVLKAGLIAAFLVAAAVVEATPKTATLFGVEGPLCPSRLVLPDHGCPGCGLTRASAMVLDGDLGAAASVNVGGVLLVAFALIALPLHVTLAVRAKKSAWIDRLLSIGRVVLAVGLIGAWLTR